MTLLDRLKEVMDREGDYTPLSMRALQLLNWIQNAFCVQGYDGYLESLEAEAEDFLKHK